jgi:hypothetical protein
LADGLFRSIVADATTGTGEEAMPPRKSTRKVADTAVAVAVALGATLTLMLPASTALAESCVTKHGSATGITRDFAEYEAFLIIRQVTGNWPFETDRFSKPVYRCKSDGALWTCHATAKVCKG